MQEKRLYHATLVIMLFGVALSLIQFLCNRSIWLDEAMLSLNIIARPYAGLLTPLDSLQVAPIGFLFAEKFFSLLIPNSEYGLRIFPLLCFWISIYLFYKITKQLFKNAKITLLAVSLFCLNSSLLYYSSEVKQYMIDVFVCLLLYYTLLKQYKKDFTIYILLALLGALSIFLSNVSIIILFTVSIFLLISQVKKQKINYLHLIIPFVTWGVVFGFYYLKFIYNHPSQGGMLAYWGKSFMPINIFELAFWDFCFYKTKMVFGSLLSFGAIGLLAFSFFLIGLYYLIKNKERKLLFLLLFPTIVQLVLSAIKLYPFDLRLILFQAGFYIIIITVGVIQVLELGFMKSQKKLSFLLFSIFPLLVVIELFKNYPAKTEEIKNSIDFLQSHIQKKDTVYIYYGAIPAFSYYQKIGKIYFKNPIIFGHGYRDSNPKYVAEIKNYKHTVWLLFSHIYNSESNYITTALDSSYKKELSYTTKDSEVYLYKYNGQ